MDVNDKGDDVDVDDEGDEDADERSVIFWEIEDRTQSGSAPQIVCLEFMSDSDGEDEVVVSRHDVSLRARHSKA